MSVPREYQDRGGRRAQCDRRAASDESNQGPDEQLELRDELDALEGFDGWSIFAEPDDEGERAA